MRLKPVCGLRVIFISNNEIFPLILAAFGMVDFEPWVFQIRLVVKGDEQKSCLVFVFIGNVEPT